MVEKVPLQESRVDSWVHISVPGFEKILPKKTTAACCQVLFISFTLSSPVELRDMAEKVPLQESRVDNWALMSVPGIMEIQIK